MNVARLGAVMRREWLELRRNRSVLGSAIVLPLLFCAASIGLLLVIARTPPGDIGGTRLPAAFAAAGRDRQAIAGSLFGNVSILLFLVMPTTVPSIMAAHSIVGEKLTRTLEPLLATPLRTTELVLGKMVTSALAGVLPAWLAFSIFVLAAHAILPPAIASLVVTPRAFVTMVCVGPPVAVLAVSLGMLVSSRSADVQAAQGWAGLLILPVVGLTITQLLGLVAISVPGVLVAAGLLVAIDAGTIALTVVVFERETILTRWS